MFLGVEVNYRASHMKVQFSFETHGRFLKTLCVQIVRLSYAIIIVCINKVGEVGGQRAWKGGKGDLRGGF